MFKWTGRSGIRRANGASGTPRISGMRQMAGRTPIELMQRRRPAFLPDMPQEQTMDSSSPRLQGLEAGH